MTIESLIDNIIRNVRSQNGHELAKQYCLNDSHINDKAIDGFHSEFIKMGTQFSLWKEMLIVHLKIINYVHDKNFKCAFDYQIQLIQLVFDLFKQIEDDNWFLPVVYAISVDLRLLALTVNNKTVSKVKDLSCDSGSSMTVAVDYIRRLFNECSFDKATTFESSKRLGMMAMCNQLFKIYFAINQFTLCKPLINAIENLGIAEKFSISHRVTFNYYVGRKSMFDNNFQKAAEYLTFAFENCHRNSVKNKKSILLYLIPVKMLMGILAHESLLLKYNLPEFIGITKSVRNGNISLLDSELNKHKEFFINCGIYLILEKLKYIAYRNLFKNVSKVMDNHLIPISVFCEALKFAGVSDIDMDETSCILANLIFENKIKGYLAHQQQKLVISKTNAFPPLHLTSLTNTR